MNQIFNIKRFLNMTPPLTIWHFLGTESKPKSFSANLCSFPAALSACCVQPETKPKSFSNPHVHFRNLQFFIFRECVCARSCVCVCVSLLGSCTSTRQCRQKSKASQGLGGSVLAVSSRGSSASSRSAGQHILSQGPGRRLSVSICTFVLVQPVKLVICLVVFQRLLIQPQQLPRTLCEFGGRRWGTACRL
jgi:hypothetical protein